MVSTFFVHPSSASSSPLRGSPTGAGPLFRSSGRGHRRILAYCFSFIPNAVWFGSYRRTIVATFIDGIAFGLITGAIFAWRWPH